MITITLNQMERLAPTLLDDFQIPNGMDADTFKNRLRFVTGELGLVYLEPCFLQEQIKIWSLSRVNSWERQLLALEQIYSPIENYNRMEDWEHVTKENEATASESRMSGSGKATEKDGAFPDSVDLKLNGEHSVENTQSDIGSGARDLQRKLTDTAHVHGNIGVTTNQQMINEELELRKKDIYNMICEEFKQEFCILLY